MRIRTNNKLLAAGLLALLLGAGNCRQAYTPPVSGNGNNRLVVDGFINNGPDSTIFTLSHTYGLSYYDTALPELHAQVFVEGKDNSSFPLGETGMGNYGAQISGLNNAVGYRLHIKTSGGKDYVSDYVSLKVSPPIDSVLWIKSDTGVRIFVNTHDPANATRYYRWDFIQTWKFHSPYFATFIYDFAKDSAILLRNNTFYYCWKTWPSTDILLGSSAKLNQDLISMAPLVTIPLNAEQLNIKYSILVRQYALDPLAYAWWQKMQKNTEQIGSIFGVQPSSTVGNIHNSADPSEQVIGYVSAGTMATKRIFISNAQVAPWDFSSSCLEGSCSKDSLQFYMTAGYMLIGAGGIGFNYAVPVCVDCTLTGSNQQPSFWQN